MEEPNKKKKLWQRLLFKYRLTLTNEENLTELWHFRINWLGMSSLVLVLFLFSLALCSALILYTPLSLRLPGAYTSTGREQLINESIRVDSLANKLDLQRAYIESIRQVVAGEMPTDSIVSLDSITLIRQEALNEAKSEVTEEFLAQYEMQEKDNLQFLFPTVEQSRLIFAKPVDGVLQPRLAGDSKNRVNILAAAGANVSSVLEGTIVSCNYSISNGFCLTIQHRSFVSVYSHVGKVFKTIGDEVKQGEAIGQLDQSGLLSLDLWENGIPVNPSEVITF